MTLDTEGKGEARGWKKGKGDFEDATLLALKMKEDATRQGM